MLNKVCFTPCSWANWTNRFTLLDEVINILERYLIHQVDDLVDVKVEAPVDSHYIALD